MDTTNDDTSSNTTSSGSGDSDWELISESGTIEPFPPTVDLKDDGDGGSDSDWETVGGFENEEDYNLVDTGLEDNEVRECLYFLKYEDTFDVDGTIFTPSDLEEMNN